MKEARKRAKAFVKWEDEEEEEKATRVDGCAGVCARSEWAVDGAGKLVRLSLSYRPGRVGHVCVEGLWAREHDRTLLLPVVFHFHNAYCFSCCIVYRAPSFTAISYRCWCWCCFVAFCVLIPTQLNMRLANLGDGHTTRRETVEKSARPRAILRTQ